MIRRVHIHNFKSVDALDLELGRINLFIGENGCGKTNILEALGMAAAAADDKLDAPSLKSRGIRVVEPRWMMSGFEASTTAESSILVCVHGRAPSEEGEIRCPMHMVPESTPYGEWQLKPPRGVLPAENTGSHANELYDKLQNSHGLPDELLKLLRRPSMELSMTDWFFSIVVRAHAERLGVTSYLCYSPREDALRDLERDSDVEPIGIHGEGLFRLLQVLEAEGMLAELKQQLGLIHWFEDLTVLSGTNPSTRALELCDLYITGKRPFDQRSANEGFLFVLLYASLLISKYTPRFFAVDNVDTALNPKLCAGVAQMFARLTEQYERQVILTTHNPGTLDGLDLRDDEQRLFVVYRNTDGMTRVRRILPTEPPAGALPVRLSEAFLRGYLGGLPTNF